MYSVRKLRAHVKKKRTTRPLNGDKDMWKKYLNVAALSAMIILGVEPAQAAGPGGFARNLMNSPGVSYIVANKPTLAPFAHVRFCLQNPGECSRSYGASTVALSSYRYSQLKRINASVNRSIRPTNDASRIDGDIWQVGANSGDCEDYALTKRKRLIAMGWSPRALRIAVAHTGTGEGHAVLVVKTSQGDLVLDNRTNGIKPWTSTDLRWVKIQSGDNPRLWYTM